MPYPPTQPRLFLVRFADGSAQVLTQAAIDALPRGRGHMDFFVEDEVTGQPKAMPQPQQRAMPTSPPMAQPQALAAPQPQAAPASPLRDGAEPPYACFMRPGPDGRIAAKTEICDGRRVEWAYGYDKAGRLASVARNGIVVEEYGYDAKGRRATERNLLRGVEERRYRYSDAGDHLASAGPLAFRHDIRAICNQKCVRGEPIDYEYANDGRLMQVTRPDGVLVSYEYDVQGCRAARYENGRCTAKYLWETPQRLAAMYDAASDAMLQFAYAPTARLPHAALLDGEPLHLFYDQIGSLRAVASAAGKVIHEIAYDTFGCIVAETGAGTGLGAGGNSGATLPIPFGYAGGLHDRSTGLIRFGVRDYDPEVGRFMAKDPLGLKGGDPDVYGYCLDDPVNRIDPTGMFSWNSTVNFFADAVDWVAGKKDVPKATRDAGRFAASEATNGTVSDPTGIREARDMEHRIREDWDDGVNATMIHGETPDQTRDRLESFFRGGILKPFKWGVDTVNDANKRSLPKR
ncbi:MAG: RHS repeat domain-containing protein [Desulfovibrionaceae bacterium]